MSSYYDPSEYYEVLGRMGFLEDMYDALEKEDTGQMIMTAIEILKKTDRLPKYSRKIIQIKNLSLFFSIAEKAMQFENYNAALVAYNRVISCAPKDSVIMVDALLGRCCLLFIIHAFTDCLIQIENCRLHCKKNKIQRKLKDMEAKCLALKWIETGISITNPFIDNFFKFNDKKHPLVPCASADIEIIKEDGKTKITAAKNIPVGKLVALETAFVGHVPKKNRFLACHFCQKFSLNLIPCDNRCECLFCSVSCKELCWAEYHKVECHLMDIIYEGCPNNRYILAIRAALKLKMDCSWDKFISTSNQMGLKSMKNISVDEIYSENNKTSILNCDDTRHFPLGPTFNGSFIIAVTVHNLQDVPDFYPKNKKDKEEAMRAFGRVILHLYVNFPVELLYANAARNMTRMAFTSEADENSAFYCFTSKLKHACDANLLLLGLNNKAALLAVKPIKPGDELQISHIGHWYETIFENRPIKLFKTSESICQCKVCVEEWDPRTNLGTALMTKEQLKVFRRCNDKPVNMLNPDHIERRYKELCQCLSAISDLPHTREHYKIFREFRDIITFFQCHATGNVTVL